jgi:hypothetical protein
MSKRTSHCQHCSRPISQAQPVRVALLSDAEVERTFLFCVRCASIPTATWRMRWRPLEEEPTKA